MAHQFTVDHHVGRCRHQRHHAADKAGKAERHHQSTSRDPHPVRHAQHHWDKNGHHPGAAHHSPQRCHRHHQQHQQLGLAAARHLHQRIPHLIGDTGAHQPIPDHEQGGNQNNVGIAETRQRLRQSESAAQHKEDDDQQGDHVHPDFIGHEEIDGTRQQREHPDKLGIQ